MAQAIPAGAILIVEDEAFVRHDLMDFFEDRGFQVFEAEDADEAVKLLAAHTAIRIVITDVDMPGSMDGMRLAHFIRDRYPPTLLLVVSGRTKPKVADLPARAVFVPKPFDPRSVLREIERMSA